MFPKPTLNDAKRLLEQLCGGRSGGNPSDLSLIKFPNTSLSASPKAGK